MSRPGKYLIIFALLFIFACKVNAQADQFCGESGLIPSLDSPFAHIPYVYGRVVLKNYDSGGKTPNVIITLAEGPQSTTRLSVGKSGNYCFRLKSNTGAGVLYVEVDGVEAARKSLLSLGSAQQREDFDIYAPQKQKQSAPGAISARFSHPTNQKTVELYKKTVEAEDKKDIDKAIKHLKEVVSIDPEDFIAWAKLGVLHAEKNSFAEAESAFRKSLELKIEYTPAWIHVGKIRIAQKQYEAAIEIFKHAITIEPTSARLFQLLGEAYLQARLGTLGVQALNQALKLDPTGMAECHLQLARLFDLAGAKNLASREYKVFLAKEPNHPDKKKLEQYIKNNPEK